MIRRFLTFVVVAALIGLAGWSCWQVIQLQQEVSALSATNSQLKQELNKYQRAKKHHPKIVEVSTSSDPSTDAELQLGKAEAALRVGNIGDALTECKAAGADIQNASNSTGSNVKNSMAALKVRLSALEQQASALLHKLGV